MQVPQVLWFINNSKPFITRISIKFVSVSFAVLETSPPLTGD